ncbi:MAG: hypothetical protein ACM32O_15160 [Clostridia bacterium]
MGVTGILHDIAALVALGCLMLPFAAMKIKKSGKEEAAKRAAKTATLLRIPQYVLVISLITGFIRLGGFYFTSWLITVLIIFLALLAFLGIATKAAKTIKQQAEQGQSYQAAAQKLFTFGVLSSVAVIAMIVFKVVA